MSRSLFSKKSELVSIIHDEYFFLLAVNKLDKYEVLESISIENFLDDSNKLDFINNLSKKNIHSLLIVPDYWISNDDFQFQSKKRPIIEAFIERKLLSEHPNMPEIINFFSYFLYNNEQKEQRLHTYFLQDINFFKIYNKFLKLNFSPYRISTPAYFYEQKIKKELPEFFKAGKALIQLMPDECFIYFFLNGNYLFSRNIKLSSTIDDPIKKISILTFEITQSLHLFSQKTKVEIDKIIAISSDKESIEAISESLGKDIKNFNYLINSPIYDYQQKNNLGAISLLNSHDLLYSKHVSSILHKALKAEMEWKPVQFSGIIIGILILIGLIFESFIINQYFKSLQLPKTIFTIDREHKQKLKNINEALDIVIKESLRPNPKDFIIKIVKSLPLNIFINEIDIDIETNQTIEIKGKVKAIDLNALKESLYIFINELNKNIQLPQQITIRDIDFEMDKNVNEDDKKNYFIKFKLNLAS